jgi:hypothetical protein
MSKFVAHSLSETRISDDRSRVELSFFDARGEQQIVSLPVGVACDLVPVLNSLVDDVSRSGNGRRFTKMPRQWAVGTAQHERLVLLKFDDDPPYALDPEVAETLWREVREEARSVSRLKAPAVQ